MKVKVTKKRRGKKLKASSKNPNHKKDFEKLIKKASLHNSKE